MDHSYYNGPHTSYQGFNILDSSIFIFFCSLCETRQMKFQRLSFYPCIHQHASPKISDIFLCNSNAIIKFNGISLLLSNCHFIFNFPDRLKHVFNLYLIAEICISILTTFSKIGCYCKIIEWDGSPQIHFYHQRNNHKLQCLSL